MARTGRPPKDPMVRKGAQISVRLAPDLRAKLQAAARDSRLGLSGEVEARLRSSFDEADRMQARIQAEFGGPAASYLFRLIARQIGTLQRLTDNLWWKDKFTFSQFELLVHGILQFFEPYGDGTPPPKLQDLHPPLGNQLVFPALTEAQGIIAGRRLEKAVVDPNSESARLGDANLQRWERTDLLREMEEQAT